MPQGRTLQWQGAAGGTRWAGRRRKEHSFPCADGPRRAPAAPGPAPALSPLPFLGAGLAGGGPVLGQVELWLWPWARPSVSREQFSFSKLEGRLWCTVVGLGTRVLFCHHHHGDLPDYLPGCRGWANLPEVQARVLHGQWPRTPVHRTTCSASPVNQASCMEMTARPLLLNSAELRPAQPRTKLADNGW